MLTPHTSDQSNPAPEKSENSRDINSLEAADLRCAYCFHNFHVTAKQRQATKDIVPCPKCLSLLYAARCEIASIRVKAPLFLKYQSSESDADSTFGRNILVVLVTGVIIAGVLLIMTQPAFLGQRLHVTFYKACSALGMDCSAPTALDAIEIQQLYVRQVQNQDDSTPRPLMDSILLNHAPFQQPFPTLALTMKDSQGRPAGRILLPPEGYLSGDLKATDLMPSKRPIHISIELESLPDSAASYKLSLSDNTSFVER